jgi:hypothetical protein
MSCTEAEATIGSTRRRSTHSSPVVVTSETPFTRTGRLLAAVASSEPLREHPDGADNPAPEHQEKTQGGGKSRRHRHERIGTYIHVVSSPLRVAPVLRDRSARNYPRDFPGNAIARRARQQAVSRFGNVTDVPGSSHAVHGMRQYLPQALKTPSTTIT